MKSILLTSLLIANIFSTYFIGGISTYGISMVDVVSVIIIFYSMYRLIWKGEPFYIPPFPFLAWISTLSIAVICSAAVPLLSSNAEMQLQWIKTFLHYVYVVVIGLAIIGSHFTVKDIHSTYKFFLYFSIFVSTFGVYQLFARAFDLPFAWITMAKDTNLGRGIEFEEWGQLSLQFGSFFRATSFFSEPSGLAGYTMQILTLLFVPFSMKNGSFISSKIMIWVLAFVNIAALVLAFSLTGVAIAITTIVFYLFFEKKISLTGVLKFLFFIPIIVFITDRFVALYTDVSVIDLFTQRIGGIYSVLFGGTVQTTGGESFFGRLDTMLRAIDIWIHYPMTGFGLGCTYLYDKVNQLTFIDSTFFTVLAETGIFGIISFVGLFGSCFFFLIVRMRYIMATHSLSPEAKRLISVIPYIFMSQVIILFTTSFFVAFWIYQTFGIIISVLIAVYEEIGLPSQQFFLIKEPLRDRLLNGIQRLRVS